MSFHVNGQTFNDMTEALHQFIKTNIKNDSLNFWIKKIILNRDTAYLSSRLTSTKSEKIKIVEVFDADKMRYGIRMQYAIDEKVEFIYVDKKEDSFYNSIKKDYQYSSNNFDTLKSGLVYFPPNTIEAICGCGQVRTSLKRKCIKNAERKAKQDGTVSEHFARLITVINKINGHINFVLELPVSGKRKVSYGGSDTNNRNWFY